MGEFMEYEFKTLKELYDRIKPALTSKRKEFIPPEYSRTARSWQSRLPTRI